MIRLQHILGWGSCAIRPRIRPLHTHQSDGSIHVEPDLNRDALPDELGGVVTVI